MHDVTAVGSRSHGRASGFMKEQKRAFSTGSTSKAGAIPHREPFALGSDGEPVVEADELERRGPPFGRQEGGSELEGVRGAERMDPEEAPGGLENGFHRLDPMPV